MVLWKDVKEAIFLAARTQWIEEEDVALRTKVAVCEGSMRSTQAYKDPESKKEIFKLHHSVK